MKWLLVFVGAWAFNAHAQMVNNFGVIGPMDEAKLSFMLGTNSNEDFQKLKAGSTEDYFQEMDRGITAPANAASLHRFLEHYIPGISQQEAVNRVVRGRNNWILWTAGNDKLWDELSRATFGNLDFLKTLSNHPNATTYRSKRWEILGLINEPCYLENAKPRADRYGLYLDIRDPSCGPDPFENAEKYPGIRMGSRGKNLKIKVNGVEKTILHEAGSFYGYGTGVIGLRLFPNPAFNQQAASRWDPKRYYEDPNYYNDPDLIKPYRVGMTCAFCHVSVSPTNPPRDFAAPAWKNLSSVAGTQNFWVDRIFAWNYKKEVDNFLYQLIHTQRPGTLDTSLVSSDQVNDPRTMNAIYDLPTRMFTAAKFGLSEELHGPQRQNFQFNKMAKNEVPDNSILRSLFVEGKEQGWLFNVKPAVDKVITPRILKDGSDSVGALGALNRVYVNIGLFSEEWLQNFVPIIGSLGLPGHTVTPFRLDKANAYSAYWQATVNQTPDVALFLLAAGTPDHLKDAPEGAKELLDYDSIVVNRGKEIFAQNCAMCHSSKQPERAYSLFKDPNCVGPGYLNCWKEFSNYTRLDPSYKEEMTKIVKSPDFLVNNFLSTDLRVPIDIVGTNICTSLATNGIRNDIWDNFTSETYKNLPSIGYAASYAPDITGKIYEESQYEMPGGGRGFLRPPSLISLWATAPFFNNNSLGPFHHEGTLEVRMDSFNRSMDDLLNPDRRGHNRQDSGEKLVAYVANGQRLRGIVDVFQKDTYLSLPKAYVPGYIYAIIPANFKTEQKNGKEYFRTRVRKQSQYRDTVVTPVEKNPSWLAKAWRSVFPASTPAPSEAQVARSIAAAYDTDDGQTPGYFSEGNNLGERLRLGPIPAGVPIGLMANINLESPKEDLIAAFAGIVNGVNAALKVPEPWNKVTAFMKHARTPLLKVSKCPDFIINKGHYFGTSVSKSGKGLDPEDQKALTEFIKHF